MKLVATRKSEQNEAVVDPWTVVHLAAGLALGLMNAPFRGSLAAAIGYEVAEQFVERTRWGEKLFDISRPESLANAAFDVVVFVAGHRAGARWNDPDG